MTDDEAKHQWEEEVIRQLKPERDKMQSQLDDIRDMRMNFQLANREKRREFLMKIGELSLLVGAAIAPIIIATDNKLQFREFAMVGAGLYLLNGILALWRCKTLLYQDAEDGPQIGLTEETLLQPVIQAHNKLLFDPSSKTYQDEYIEVSKGLTDEGLALEGQKQKARLDLWADMAIYGFGLATLLVARTIWPFEQVWYWEMLLGFALLVCVLLLVGYRHARKTRAAIEQKLKRILDQRKKYQEWHNKEVFRKQDGK